MIEPAHLWIPDRVGSYGDEAIDLATEAGKTLDEEQQLAVDALLSYGPGGKWVALEAAIIEARQQGKTTNVLTPITMFDLWLLPPDRIVWTAHLFRTARDAFEDFLICIETSPALSRRVKKISSSHGEEFIELHPPKKSAKSDPSRGAKLEFLARSTGGGRGLGGKRVVMDEALILSAGSMGALMPTMSARDNPQINYGSSGAKENSDHLHGLIKRGRKGGDPSLVWVEFCAPGSWENPPCASGRKCLHVPDTAGCALDDETLWPRGNHAIGRPGRTTYEYVRAERRALPPYEFGRERLGWHEIPLDEAAAIDLAGWSKSVDSASKRHGDVTLAVDIAPAQDSAAIGLFGMREDGLEHMQLMDVRPGVDWVVPRMLELRSILDPVGWGMGRGTWAALKDELLKHDFKRPEKRGGDEPEPERGDVAVVQGADMSACCGQMLNATRPTVGDDGQLHYRIRHLGQVELDQAVAAARIRETADAVVWSRKDSTANICPLFTVSEARWLFGAWAHLVNNDYDLMDSVL